jgi:hypothetical protein
MHPLTLVNVRRPALWFLGSGSARLVGLICRFGAVQFNAFSCEPRTLPLGPKSEPFQKA